MSDGSSFIESNSHERIRKLRPAGGTKHDSVPVLEGRRKLAGGLLMMAAVRISIAAILTNRDLCVVKIYSTPSWLT
jgi:hypothetical protein